MHCARKTIHGVLDILDATVVYSVPCINPEVMQITPVIMITLCRAEVLDANQPLFVGRVGLEAG